MFFNIFSFCLKGYFETLRIQCVKMKLFDSHVLTVPSHVLTVPPHVQLLLHLHALREEWISLGRVL